MHCRKYHSDTQICTSGNEEISGNMIILLKLIALPDNLMNLIQPGKWLSRHFSRSPQGHDLFPFFSAYTI